MEERKYCGRKETCTSSPSEEQQIVARAKNWAPAGHEVSYTVRDIYSKIFNLYVNNETEQSQSFHWNSCKTFMTVKIKCTMKPGDSWKRKCINVRRNVFKSSELISFTIFVVLVEFYDFCLAFLSFNKMPTHCKFIILFKIHLFKVFKINVIRPFQGL